MDRSDLLYRQYLDILREELRPAMGCTEPIALAYAGALARQLLGKLPDKVEAYVSGNIIKNVKALSCPIPAVCTASPLPSVQASWRASRKRSWR